MARTSTIETMTETNAYRDMPQDEAAKHAAAFASAIAEGLASETESLLSVGRTLNLVRDTGVAVAASADVDGGERAWDADTKAKSVSAFLRDNGVPLTPQRANELQKYARRHDELTAKGVDVSAFVPSSFKYVGNDISMTAFVKAIKSAQAKAKKAGKAKPTAADIRAAVDPTWAPATTTTTTKATATDAHGAIVKAGNALVTALADADADKLSDAERQTLANVIKAITDIAPAK